jgi:hypothetical protein
MRCCTGDGGLMAPRSRPRGVASSRLMLRWLKTVVVSDEEKAHEMRQAGTRKATTVKGVVILSVGIRTGATVHVPG